MSQNYTNFNPKFWVNTGQPPVVGIVQRGINIPDEDENKGAFYEVADNEIIDGGDESCNLPRADFSTVSKMVQTAVNINQRMFCWYVSPGQAGGFGSESDRALARQKWQDYKLLNGLSGNNQATRMYVTIITQGSLNGSDDPTPVRFVGFLSSKGVTQQSNRSDGKYEYEESFFLCLGSGCTPTISTGTRVINFPSKCFSFVVEMSDPKATACMVPLESPFCQLDPVTSELVQDCFPVGQTVQGALQNECTLWWQGELNDGLRDAYNIAMSGAYPDLVAFKCTLAENDPSYRLLITQPLFAATKKGCFWKYCDNTNLRVLVLTTDQRNDCPNNVCINSTDFEEIDQSEINDLQQNMTCFVDDSGGGGGGGGGGNNTEEEVTDIGITLIIVGVIVGFILLGVGLFIFFRNRRKENEEGKK